MVDEDCCRCWNCENDEGILRWENENDIDDETKQKEKDNSEKLKPIAMEMK